jgi:fumarate reductase subunit C
VWTYLEKVLPISSKQELSTIYLVQIISSAIIIIVALLSFVAVLLIFRVKEEIKPQADEIPDKTEEINKKEISKDQFKRSIFLQILKLRGLNQIASPQNIALEINQDPDIVLAHLWKLHNEQYVTFQTGGLKPTVDTDFFLSPKAFEIINLSPLPPRPQKPSQRSRKKSWVRDW